MYKNLHKILKKLNPLIAGQPINYQVKATNVLLKNIHNHANLLKAFSILNELLARYDDVFYQEYLRTLLHISNLLLALCNNSQHAVQIAKAIHDYRALSYPNDLGQLITREHVEDIVEVLKRYPDKWATNIIQGLTYLKGFNPQSMPHGSVNISTPEYRKLIKQHPKHAFSLAKGLIILKRFPQNEIISGFTKLVQWPPVTSFDPQESQERNILTPENVSFISQSPAWAPRLANALKILSLLPEGLKKDTKNRQLLLKAPHIASQTAHALLEFFEMETNYREIPSYPTQLGYESPIVREVIFYQSNQVTSLIDFLTSIYRNTTSDISQNTSAKTLMIQLSQPLASNYSIGRIVKLDTIENLALLFHFFNSLPEADLQSIVPEIKTHPEQLITALRSVVDAELSLDSATMKLVCASFSQAPRTFLNNFNIKSQQSTVERLEAIADHPFKNYLLGLIYSGEIWGPLQFDVLDSDIEADAAPRNVAQAMNPMRQHAQHCLQKVIEHSPQTMPWYTEALLLYFHLNLNDHASNYNNKIRTHCNIRILTELVLHENPTGKILMNRYFHFNEKNKLRRYISNRFNAFKESALQETKHHLIASHSNQVS